MRPRVALLGTCDTKGREFAYLRDRLADHGVDAIVIDAGVFEPVGITPDVTHEVLARAAGTTPAALADVGDRGEAVTAMGVGARAVVHEMFTRGEFAGLLAMGGGGGSSIAAAALQALPIGTPKLLVSTLASGDTRPYVGGSDVTLMHSVVDISGINQISVRILSNAAAAIAGMVASPPVPGQEHDRPLLAASMFGVTTPCVTVARELLEARGFEVLVFHQTGTGGQAQDELVRAGFVRGVLDITATELADELVGGVLPAHPERFEVAGGAGIPQVVSVGALDMVNFGPRATVPDRFEGRRFYIHNPTVTLMRTTAEECAELGRRLAAKLNRATGPVTVYLPLRGVSQIAVEGGPFHNPEADAALFDALRTELDQPVELHEMDTDINDPAFATAMATRLEQMVAMQG